MVKKLVKTALLILIPLLSISQERGEVKPIPFGDMEQWLTRDISESFLIGGKTRTIFEIAPKREIEENTPYVPQESQWATSSVYARVAGITKGSISVFPEQREDGSTCARLETVLEKVRVLGIINISALATGTIFMGSINEPIRDTDNPQAKLNTGIEWDKEVRAMIFDYKVDPASERIYDNGLSRTKKIPGQNAAEAVILLQHRWEDKDGNIYAERVGTGWERYDKKVEQWQNNHRIEVVYGDITKNSDFKPYKGLLTTEPLYCENSKGETVMINEKGWAKIGTKPTHLVVRFSSGFGGAYVGSIGSKFWIDNVKFEY